MKEGRSTRQYGRLGPCERNAPRRETLITVAFLTFGERCRHSSSSFLLPSSFQSNFCRDVIGKEHWLVLLLTLILSYFYLFAYSFRLLLFISTVLCLLHYPLSLSFDLITKPLSLLCLHFLHHSSSPSPGLLFANFCPSSSLKFTIQYALHHLPSPSPSPFTYWPSSS